MEAQKLNDLQIRVLAIAQCLDGIEVKGKDNMQRLISAMMELEKFSKELTGKKLADEMVA